MKLFLITIVLLFVIVKAAHLIERENVYENESNIIFNNSIQLDFHSNLKFQKGDLGLCFSGYLNLSIENDYNNFTVEIINDIFEECKENCYIFLGNMGDCRSISVVINSAGFSNLSYSFSMLFVRKYDDNNYNTVIHIVNGSIIGIYLFLGIIIYWFDAFKYKCCCYKGTNHDILCGKCLCITNHFKCCQGSREYSPIDQ